MVNSTHFQALQLIHTCGQPKTNESNKMQLITNWNKCVHSQRPKQIARLHV